MTRFAPRIAGRALAAVATLTLTTALAACSSDPSSAASATSSAKGVTVTDAWIKAADSGMTSMFATVHNDTADLVAVTGATTDLSPVELHETTTDTSGNSTMSTLAGGLTIPAGKTVAFEPGGYHFMLTKLSGPVEAGGAYKVTILLSDGERIAVTAQGRSYAGAQESYGDMPSMATPSAS